MMSGRGGPFGDPRMFKQMFWGPGPGPGGPGGPGHRGGHRGRARRGDVRAALLLLIEGGAQNGYQLIQEIERRTRTFWKPSPGSVYPALQQLEDEGLVHADETAGRRAFSLTDEGRAHVEQHEAELAAVWDAVRGDEDDPRRELRGLVGQLAAAAYQVSAAGGEAQVTAAKQVLTEARRTLYRLLADDEPAAAQDEPPASQDEDTGTA